MIMNAVFTWQAFHVRAVPQGTNPTLCCSSSRWWWRSGTCASHPSSWLCWQPPRALSCSQGGLEKENDSLISILTSPLSVRKVNSMYKWNELGWLRLLGVYRGKMCYTRIPLHTTHGTHGTLKWNTAATLKSRKCTRALTQQRLPLAHTQLVVELFADHTATGIKLVRCHVGDLQQHGWHQIHTLQQF